MWSASAVLWKSIFFYKNDFSFACQSHFILTFQIHQKAAQVNRLLCRPFRLIARLLLFPFSIRGLAWSKRSRSTIKKTWKTHYFNITEKTKIEYLNAIIILCYKIHCHNICTCTYYFRHFVCLWAFVVECTETGKHKIWCKLFAFDHFIIRFSICSWKFLSFGTIVHTQATIVSKLIVWIASHKNKNYRFVFVDRASVGMLR